MSPDPQTDVLIKAGFLFRQLIAVALSLPPPPPAKPLYVSEPAEMVDPKS